MNNYAIFEHIMDSPEYIDDIFANFFIDVKNSVGFLFELVQIAKVVIQVYIGY